MGCHVDSGCDQDKQHPQVLPNKDTVQTVRSMPDVWDGTTVITAVWTRVTDID